MMTDEEKHSTLQDEVSEEQHPSSSLEQAFSSLTITDRIGQNLSTQDLYRSSLVKPAWNSASREYLKASSKKAESDYRLCVQINDQNPCRALANFNVFLEENPDGITFNGIRHNEDYNHIFETSGRVTCPNCLMNDWEKENNDAALTEEQNQKKILEVYGNILNKVEFKYIWVQIRASFVCPFARFIKYVIQGRAEEIVELEFDGERFSKDSDCIAFYMSRGKKPASSPCTCGSLQFGRSYLGWEDILFPKLEILGVRSPIYNLGVRAPALREIKHFILSPDNDLPRYFPYQGITRTEIGDEIVPDVDVQYILYLIESFRPKIKALGIWDTCIGLNEFDENKKNQMLDLFKLGQRTSSTLTELACSASDFRFIANKVNNLDNNGEENSCNDFPLLERLTLHGYLDQELQIWLGSTDCSQRFPKLHQVDLLCDIPESNDLNGRGSTTVQDNRITDLGDNRANKLPLSTSAFEGVHTLRLENYGCSVRGFPSVLRTHFSGITHLEFKNLMDDNHRHELLMEVMTVAMNLPCLQELTIYSLGELKYLYLDNLFPEKPPETENTSTGNSRHHPENYFKQLKQVNICYDYSICCWIKNHCNENGSQYYEVPDDLPENSFVSSHLAENICKYCPNFKFTLTIKACGPECQNFLGPANQYIENLEPYAVFSSKRKQENCIWEIDFIDKSGCTNTKS